MFDSIIRRTDYERRCQIVFAIGIGHISGLIEVLGRAPVDRNLYAQLVSCNVASRSRSYLKTVPSGMNHLMRGGLISLVMDGGSVDAADVSRYQNDVATGIEYFRSSDRRGESRSAHGRSRSRVTHVRDGPLRLVNKDSPIASWKTSTRGRPDFT